MKNTVIAPVSKRTQAPRKTYKPAQSVPVNELAQPTRLKRIAKKPSNKAVYDEKIKAALLIIEKAKIARADLKDMKEHKKFFVKEFESKPKSKRNKIATKSGLVIYYAKNSYSVDTLKIPELKKLFGKQYKEFVIEEKKYKTTAKLKALLSDPNYEHAELIRSAVIIDSRRSVRFMSYEGENETE